MARILVVEDRASDRKLLTLLLTSAGYEVTGVGDGGEALDAVVRLKPDLVISDILMPSVDGYQFVMRMRKLDGLSQTPVIFYTATYHEDEARALASQCGVVDVLVKPSSAATILSRIADVIDRPPDPVDVDDAAFNEDHYRVVSAALVARAGDLEASRHRLASLIELGTRLADERNPAELLRLAAATARDVTFAQYAVVGLLTDDQRAVAGLTAVGIDRDAGARLSLPSLESPLIRRLVTDRRPVREVNSGGDPVALGLPADHGPVRSFLGVPLISGTRLVGWIGLRNKLGADEFSELDERVATAVGVQAGVAYENARLYTDLLRRSVELEREAAERARAEHELRANEERIRYALTEVGGGTWDCDLVSGEMHWSDSIAAVFGASPSASMTEFFESVHVDDRARVTEAFDAAARGGGDFSIECRIVGHDGVVRWVDSRARIRFDDDHRPVRATGIVVSIEGRKSLEEQLRVAQKLEVVGQLAGGLAHDFNNLLTTVIGYTNLVSGTLDPGDPREADLAEIRSAANSAASLTQQLLAASRRQIVQPVLLDVNERLRETTGLLGRLIGEHIELAVVLGATDPYVRMDPGQLEQIVMNLTVNARDAMPDGGTLTISTAMEEFDEERAARHDGGQRGAYVRIAVTDTGTGMSPEVQARIFEPFFTTKERGKGTGLGLATVYGIVRQNRGSVSVSSEAGRGTTLEVFLPVVEPGEGRPAAAAHAPARGGAETVLVVEDERAVRFLIRTALARAGYTVREAAEPQEALAGDLADGIALLVTDVLMPGMRGPELYRRLRETRPDLKVLYVSGFADEPVAEEAIRDGTAGFLAKPFSADDLLRRVRSMLDDD